MLIDKELLDRVSSQALASERLRMNFNFHDDLKAPSQRMLNALELGTLLPPHRHHHAAETIIVLRGKLRVDFYNDDKNLTETYVLDPLQGVYGIDITKGQWHGYEVLEANTVIFETKDGPYTPITAQDLLFNS